jgi:hypothetical protein
MHELTFVRRICLAVRSLSVHSRPSRLAAILALLAVLAQLWIGQVSAEHLARLLSGDMPWGDICSAQDSSREGGSTDSTGHSGHLHNALSCPVCSASASGSAPLVGLGAQIEFAQTQQPQPLREQPALLGSRIALRPPARAPPVA